MPDTTPTFGFPFPEETDPTDVPGDLEGLALGVEAALSAHLSDTTDAHDASAISYVPASTVAATDVQAAITEVASEADARLTAMAATIAPIGSIVMWPTATPPTGWLICNGSTFTAATYPTLNTLLGGNTLPDLRDRVPVGVSGTKAAKSTGGAASVALTATELPNHAHSMTHGHTYGPMDAGTAVGTSTSRPVQSGGSTVSITPNGSVTAFVGNTGAAGSGGAFSVQNPYVALNFIIRAA